MTISLRFSLQAALALGVLLQGSAAGPGIVPAASVATPASTSVTFNVNSVNDAVADFTGEPNFDICRTNSANNTCTLRAAIMNANRHLGSATINLPTGTYQLSILPVGSDDDASGSLDFSHTVTLAGAGAAGTIVDGESLDRVFFLTSTAVVTITGITIQHGHSDAGGAIYNFFGQLSLANTVLSGNYANGDGGGLINFGAAIISQSTIVANTAANNGGGVNNFGTLTIDTSTLDDNTAIDGGALENNGGDLTLFDSTLSNNSASQDGGGIHNAGTARIFHTTIAGNLADNDTNGGGLGGGIRNTLSAPHVQIYNSMLADNYLSHTVSDCSGPITSQDYNLILTTSGCAIAGITTHNFIDIGADSLLASLVDNGGSTQTRALLAGNPALDRIPPALCRDPFGTAPVPDQRGVARPVNGLCDIGAYEGSQPMPLFGRNLVHNGDAEANAGSPSGGWVGVPGWLTSGQFSVVPYKAAGGFPTVPTDTVPASHGANFFAGGSVAISGGFQRFDLSAVAGLIDSGNVRFVLSGDLGGFLNQADNAQVTVGFFDHASHLLPPVATIGPVSAADRGNKTGLLPRTVSGAVPAGARIVSVNVTMTRVSTAGPYNDGYADNISLVLLPPPLFLPTLFR